VTQFLSAGRSKKPEQIFKDIGIEVGPRLFNEGLRSIEYDLDELERLMRHTK
jgi:oligoendopeptidase F